nr:reverse transcriptase domain-containing protein [Tanacetum cinerariifolium]
MKEVHYHDWLSNPVMVKKHDDSWIMCVDFKDLNKGCLKEGYPLPEIDWKVESLCGFPFKCFLDAYKGYHQIQMVKEDEEKTAFITNQEIFFYTKMSFSLRNARATYQRLVNKAFHKQIGRNLKVYVDDLVIKSRTKDEIVRDIEETFKTIREINIKLNPKNCTFRVEEGTFLEYKVSTKGLKVCPDKRGVTHNVSKPLPLGGPPSQAAYYPDVDLVQMVPDHMWIEEEYKYDIAAIYGVQMIMRFNEIHKFGDGTLQQIDEALDYRVKEFTVNRMNPGLNIRFWTRKDVDRSKEFIFTIQKRLKTTRIFYNLESFVGGRVRDGDYRLLKRTE